MIELRYKRTSPTFRIVKLIIAPRNIPATLNDHTRPYTAVETVDKSPAKLRESIKYYYSRSIQPLETIIAKPYEGRGVEI